MSKRTYYKRDELGRFAKEDYSGLSASELSEKLREELSEGNGVKVITPITDEAIERGLLSISPDIQGKNAKKSHNSIKNF